MGSLEECGSRLEWDALSCKVTAPGLAMNQEPHKDDLTGKSELGEACSLLRVLCVWSETVSNPPP